MYPPYKNAMQFRTLTAPKQLLIFRKTYVHVLLFSNVSRRSLILHDKKTFPFYSIIKLYKANNNRSKQSYTKRLTYIRYRVKCNLLRTYIFGGINCITWMPSWFEIHTYTRGVWVYLHGKSSFSYYTVPFHIILQSLTYSSLHSHRKHVTQT